MFLRPALSTNTCFRMPRSLARMGMPVFRFTSYGLKSDGLKAFDFFGSRRMLTRTWVPRRSAAPACGHQSHHASVTCPESLNVISGSVPSGDQTPFFLTFTWRFLSPSCQMRICSRRLRTTEETRKGKASRGALPSYSGLPRRSSPASAEHSEGPASSRGDFAVALFVRRPAANEGWWRHGDSNPGPLACHASALPTELCPQPIGVRRTGGLYPRRRRCQCCGVLVSRHSDYVTPHRAVRSKPFRAISPPLPYLHPKPRPAH